MNRWDERAGLTRRPAAGFTLIELILVMTLLVVVIALSFQTGSALAVKIIDSVGIVEALWLRAGLGSPRPAPIADPVAVQPAPARRGGAAGARGRERPARRAWLGRLRCSRIGPGAVSGVCVV